MTAKRIHGTVIDEFNWIGATCVLRLADIGKVRHAVPIENDVLKYGPPASSGSENLRFVFFGQIDEFCIASTFEVEDPVRTPSVLVITDEGTLWIGRERGLSCSREAKEDRRILAVGVSGTVHWKDALLR